MEIRMQFDELCRMLSDYVQVGYMEAVRAYEPARDRVRQTEVKAWLKFMHADMELFRKLEKRGDIKARRIGKAVNSPLYYSKREIKQAMASVGILRTVNDYGHPTRQPNATQRD